jgi:hypothetical protein
MIVDFKNGVENATPLDVLADGTCLFKSVEEGHESLEDTRP